MPRSTQLLDRQLVDNFNVLVFIICFVSPPMNDQAIPAAYGRQEDIRFLSAMAAIRLISS